MRRRVHLFVDVHDASVKAYEKRPARGERLILIYDAVRGRDRLGRIAQQRIVDAQRLRESLVGLRRVDADGKMRDVEAPDLFATLTE